MQEHGRWQRAAVGAGCGQVLHCRISKRMGGQHSASGYLALGIYVPQGVPIETALGRDPYHKGQIGGIQDSRGDVLTDGSIRLCFVLGRGHGVQDVLVRLYKSLAGDKTNSVSFFFDTWQSRKNDWGREDNFIERSVVVAERRSPNPFGPYRHESANMKATCSTFHR